MKKAFIVELARTRKGGYTLCSEYSIEYSDKEKLKSELQELCGLAFDKAIAFFDDSEEFTCEYERK